jgi:hypothetical protein
VSPLHVVKRHIPGERLVTELKRVFVAACGPPNMPRIDNTRNWIRKRCNSSATARSGCPAPRPDALLNNGYVEAFNNGYERMPHRHHSRRWRHVCGLRAAANPHDARAGPLTPGGESPGNDGAPQTGNKDGVMPNEHLPGKAGQR